MSEEYPRRGRNWLTAMGVLFLVVAAVTLVRDIIIWSPDFVFQFFFDSEINAQKISLGAIAFGSVYDSARIRKEKCPSKMNFYKAETCSRLVTTDKIFNFI